MRIRKGDKISSLNLPSTKGEDFTINELEGKKH